MYPWDLGLGLVVAFWDMLAAYSGVAGRSGRNVELKVRVPDF